MNGHRSAFKKGEDTLVADHFKEKHSVCDSVPTSTPEEVDHPTLPDGACLDKPPPLR